MNVEERIVDQALQLFESQGIKAVRMDDLAQRVGLSKRTLYGMFGDKEELLYRIMLRYFENNRQRSKELSAGARDVLEEMFIGLEYTMARSEQTNRMMESLRRFYPSLHDRLMREGIERNGAELRGMLRRGIEQSLFVDTVNLDLAVGALYYAASGLVVRRDLILPEGMTEREALWQIITTFFRGIATLRGLRVVDEYLLRFGSDVQRR